jgi:anaerobic magnesium-protoporphyrin IX monomethyl ester cyclase
LNILLIRGPNIFSGNAYTNPLTLPLGTAYLAGNLRKKGHRVTVIDAIAEDIKHIGNSFAENVFYRGLSDQGIVDRITEAPDGIGITTMFSQEWPHLEQTIRAIKNKFPNVPIIVGGEHATAAADYILESCPAVDMVALGEGEETVIDFADWVGGNKAIEQIAGVKYMAEGKVATNPARARILEPDELPWPAWDLFNIEPYFEMGFGMGVERGRTMPIVATRGCPYQCSFCSSPQMWTTRYVMRNVESVVDEIEHYVKQYNVTNIDFYDLTFVIKKQWTLAYCAEIKRRGLKFTWQLPSGTRSEVLDDEVLKAMSETGCTNVAYAPESGSVRMLAAIKKKIKLPSMVDSIKTAKKHDVFVRCNLILGFPTETRQDMWATVWLAMRFAWIGVDDTTLHSFSPYPGSADFKYLQSTGRIGKMDREYFTSLMGFADLTRTADYCEHVRPGEITAYRLVGLSLFYGFSYLLRPTRILRSINNYRNGVSDTSFESRIFGLIRRRRMEDVKISPTLPVPEAVAV